MSEPSIRTRTFPFAVIGGAIAVAIVLAAAGPGNVPAGAFGQGAVSGAALALYSVAAVLVFRSSRVLNVATVQLGAFAASVFATLAQGGTLLRWGRAACPPCLDTVGPAARGASTVVSLLIALALSAGVGWCVHALVIRRLRDAPPLVPLVATVFVVQVLAGMQGALPQFLLTKGQRERDIVRGAVVLPGDRAWQLGGATFHLPDLLLVISAVMAVAGVGVLLRSSRAGALLRAAASNPGRAAALGIDGSRVAGLAWLAGGLLAGLAGTLTAANVGADAVAGGVAIPTLVRIFTLLVLARFSQVTIAALAAIALGVIDTIVGVGFGTQLPVDGALVFVVSAVLLASRPDRETRAEAESSTWPAQREVRALPRQVRMLPSVTTARRITIAGVGLTAVALPWLLTPAQTTLVTVAGAYAIVGLSVLVLTGWAGAVSLGQFGFAAVGAWVAASLRLPFLIALPIGALSGAAMAVLVGLPALRLRGLQLAISTLAFSLTVSAVLLNPRYLGRFLPETVERPSLLGIDLDDARAAWYVGLILIALCTLAVGGLRRSRTGRALIATRDNDRAAASVGIAAVPSRLLAFAISGGLAAIAGVWFSVLSSGVAPDAFGPDRGVTLFVYAVIGGLGSLAGPLLGFAAFALLGLVSSDQTIVALAGGGGGLALILGVPGGLGALAAEARDAMARRAVQRQRLSDVGLSKDEIVPIAANPRQQTVPAGRYALEHQWGIPSAD